MLEAWGFMTPAYVEEQLSFLLSKDQPHTYVQRGTNILQTIFKKHLQDFAENYEAKYARTYGRIRLERIIEMVEHGLNNR